MKTGFDVTSDVRTLVNVPAAHALLGVTGKVYQNERPSGRASMTDLVVNCLGVTNDLLQKGSGNINGYVPALVNGEQKLADQVKLSTMANLIVQLVDSQWKETFSTWIEDAPTIFQDTDGSWFVNIPFKYQSYNKEFKNI